MYHVQHAPSEISYHVFRLVISTPEKVVYDEEVVSLTAPGAQGSFQILVDHAHYMSLLEEGKIVIVDRNKQSSEWQLGAGYFEIAGNRAFLLADSAQKIEEPLAVK